MSKNKVAKTLIRCLALTAISTQSPALGGLVSTMTNLYTQAKEQIALKKINSPDNIGGLYEGYLTSTNDNHTIASTEAIDTMHQQYNQLEACHTNKNIIKKPQKIRKTDLINILLHNGVSIPGIDENTTSAGTRTLKTSCDAVMTCLNQANNIISECKNIVTATYQNYTSQGVQQSSISNDLYGAQFFNNGTLDDSAYDLMLDMKLIGDVMFKNNQKPAQIKFYTMPSLTNPANENPNPPATPNNPKKNPNSPQSPSPKSPNQSNPNSPHSITKTPQNPNSKNSNTTNTQNPNSPTNSPKTNTKSTLKPKTNTETTTGSPLFGQDICTSDQSSEETTENTETEKELTLEEQNQIREDYMTDISSIYDGYNPLKDLRKELGKKEKNGEGEGENGKKGGKMGELKNFEKVQQCVIDCGKNYKGTEALMCKAKCLCSVIEPDEPNKYIDYKIKFCRIPSKEEAPYNSVLKVQSVEEIVDQINTTLIALRQSGAMNKRNETQEYLDTTLKHLNIGDSFVFTFNIGPKTSPQTKSKKQKQKEADQAFREATQGSTIYKNDVNKYANTYQKTEINTIPTQTEAMTTARMIADRQEVLAHTLTQFDAFRKNLQTQLTEIQNISLSMKTKAENPK